MPLIAIATDEKHPDISSELFDREDLLVSELSKRGVKVDACVWNDPEVDWTQYDLVLPRAVWDYIEPDKFPRFREWLRLLEESDVKLLNPPEMIRWNMDKHYLLDLQKRGVLIPDSIILDHGKPQGSLLEIMQNKGWNDVFIRPCVAGDSHWSLRVRLEAEMDSQSGQRQVDKILNTLGKDVLVQRFVKEVVERGEWTLIFFNKRYSHGVNRVTVDDGSHGFLKGFSVRLQPIPNKVKDAAKKVIDSIPEDVLYARVDLMESGNEVVLVELEKKRAWTCEVMKLLNYQNHYE